MKKIFAQLDIIFEITPTDEYKNELLAQRGTQIMQKDYAVSVRDASKGVIFLLLLEQSTNMQKFQLKTLVKNKDIKVLCFTARKALVPEMFRSTRGYLWALSCACKWKFTFIEHLLFTCGSHKTSVKPSTWFSIWKLQYLKTMAECLLWLLCEDGSCSEKGSFETTVAWLNIVIGK